jgi:hypothetical protein
MERKIVVGCMSSWRELNGGLESCESVVLSGSPLETEIASVLAHQIGERRGDLSAVRQPAANEAERAENGLEVLEIGGRQDPDERIHASGVERLAFLRENETNVLDGGSCEL